MNWWESAEMSFLWKGSGWPLKLGSWQSLPPRQSFQSLFFQKLYLDIAVESTVEVQLSDDVVSVGPAEAGDEGLRVVGHCPDLRRDKLIRSNRSNVILDP